MAALFAAGSLFCVPTLVLRPWPEVWIAGVAFNCVSAGVTATLLFVFRRRVGQLLRHLAIVVGIVDTAIALAIGGGGSATSLYAVLYVWIGLYLGLEFAPRVVAVYLGIAAITGGTVLAIVCKPAAAVTIGLTTMVSMASATVIAGYLSARIKSLAVRDPLTGVANRRLLEEHLARLESRRRPRPMAIITIDLDGFKRVNDNMGHAAGDALLVDAAACWSSLLRPEDLLARVGGDEFVVVLDDCDQERAQIVGHRLARATPRPVTASVGIACSDGSGSLDMQLGVADEAAYRSKAQGGATVTTLPYAAIPG
jgi:diguanylate cyclase (GGDEF)-like protein